MDFLKKASQSFGGSSSQNQQQQQVQGGQPVQKDDYVDKAFSSISKKFGFNGSKEQNEKITDAGREFYEKQTGKKVSSKVSSTHD